MSIGSAIASQVRSSAGGANGQQIEKQWPFAMTPASPAAAGKRAVKGHIDDHTAKERRVFEVIGLDGNDDAGLLQVR